MPTTALNDETLARLLSNNSKWAAAVDVADPAFFQTSTKGQAPKVLWIGCSDSRVPESVLLGCKPGDVFVTRNIANQVHLHDDNILSVLAYAVAELGVEHVVVAGHTCCGGAAACLALAAAPPPPPTARTSPLQRWLTPLTTLARTLADAHPTQKLDARELVDASVAAQVQNVLESDVVRDAWSADPDTRGKARLKGVHGWVYDLERGRVRDLGISVWAQ